MTVEESAAKICGDAIKDGWQVNGPQFAAGKIYLILSHETEGLMVVPGPATPQ